MKIFIKILLFVLVSLIANVKAISAATTSTDIQEITSSFHTEIPKQFSKSLKVIRPIVVKMNEISYIIETGYRR